MLTQVKLVWLNLTGTACEETEADSMRLRLYSQGGSTEHATGLISVLDCVCECLPARVYVRHVHVCYPLRLEGAVEYPGTGVTGSCKRPCG